MAGKIPISAAKAISEKHDCPVVVLFALDATGNRFNVTTYGKTKALCRHAASLAEQIAAKVMGGEIAPAETEEEVFRFPNEPKQWEGRTP